MAKYTIEAGRGIVRNGTRIATIAIRAISPTEGDAMARRIVAALNACQGIPTEALELVNIEPTDRDRFVALRRMALGMLDKIDG